MENSILTFTFLTAKNMENEAHIAVEELARALNVYCTKAFLIAKNFVPGEHKWNITVKGTQQATEIFKKQAKNIVREW